MLLAIDLGSSSVKAALLEGGEVLHAAPSVKYRTDYNGERAEVPVERIEDSLREAVRQLDLGEVDAIGLIGMAPAWLAMDERGGALTPFITHQDRRSIPQARRIEKRLGRERHLALAGNRPTPGGISSTTAAWFAAHTDVIDRASMLGHLMTWLLHRLTGQWMIDPSNAGFTGLMDVATLDWSEELCAAAEVPRAKLPAISELAARKPRTRDNDLGIPPGLPLVGGLVDGSGAMLLAGARPGTLIHSAGSTDVLALCLDRHLPRDGLLLRPLGAGGLWISAATLAAGGSAVGWARRMLFPDVNDAGRDVLLRRAAAHRVSQGLAFDPYLAGDRQSVDQPTGAFTGLTLATTPLDMLAAVLHSISDSSDARVRRLLDLADEAGLEVHRDVVLTGGLAEVLRDHLHAGWPGEWRFRYEPSATARGLARLM